MLKRDWLRTAFLVSGLAVALTAQDAVQAPAPQDYQPGQVIQVTAHHSRWDYPKEITLPEGTQLHIVEKGDTLWDLGNKYLGNPFAWPQIWELNQWITDPHWIYPGDHLIVATGRGTIKPGDTPAEVTELGPGKPSLQGGIPVREEYAFTFQDFIRLPYLAPNGADALFKELGAVKVASQQSELKSEFGDLDTIYLDGGADKGLKVGYRLLALKVIKKKLYHPNDKREEKPLGDVVKQIGVVRVIQIQPNAAVAIIEKAGDSLNRGDMLVAFVEPANIQNKLRTDLQEPVPIQKPEARIVFVGDAQRQQAGAGMMAIIDKGEQDGYKVGDVLLSVRERAWPIGSPEANTKASTNYLVSMMMVVKTLNGSSTCRILRAREEVVVGDIVTH